ncbi:GHKL domain-containing protein [Natronorubrum sp. JWXQ-INN-674]|uniref:histidine kinase n=1 Tax=Natronorubrum halalkaliphilum TaxID=2691917 RepID=A0A6B0VN45_9EURY|nr:MEDS domain-containing protein [Natronorubrum halalkaliphilum]MXV63020.1 GHKL domain-containing protein [Natronorubrum halalkaliphilum]
MSHESNRSHQQEFRTEGGTHDSLTVESGLEALQSNSEFHGTVEPLDGLEELETCEHIALFHKTREERFATVAPFIRQGIEQGERVMYVIDDLPKSVILGELRGGDVNIDAALESGQLTFHSLEETYLRSGRFDPDDMIDVYAEAIDEAKAEYPGLRVTASTNFILDEQATIADFMAYESRVNKLFQGEDCIALCHYDCNAIPAETLVDVIRTHPHIVYDDTVCHNFYYTPPEEFFEPDESIRDVERMLNTLVDHSEARTELNETIEELEESNERLRRFAYVASHDLQEPLRMISSYLQLLESRYADELDEEAREYIDFAVNGSDRMREMVEGLLAYSRIDMDDAEFEPVTCENVVEDVLTDLQVQIDETDATILVGSLPTVVGNAQQLEQLFSNLISNAIKYSGDQPPHVEISAEQQGDRCVFSVADNGIGIDPEYVDQIFEIFNRLHSNDEFQGTGIGLSLCRKIVNSHDGDIWVDTEPGDGTTFYFTLPTAR